MQHGYWSMLCLTQLLYFFKKGPYQRDWTSRVFLSGPMVKMMLWLGVIIRTGSRTFHREDFTPHSKWCTNECRLKLTRLTSV